ncbi:MAG: tRNA (adenosine(37)-N6)-threonylcarbamoyltransferase complex dimerization subunit type 1 TsaB [Burkholderiaceae bacterium]|nr:tRNA (adenosine(37)-N6)-threonylcarbamoyltransferase complex dimerization subunit type 1 TsaB [Burkholderiaceae bacterium]
MTPLLAMESAAEVGSVALMQPSGALSFSTADSGQSHSGQLLPIAETLLKQAGLSWSSLSGLAVGIGPGSFTGIRIACGIAQGLSLGMDRPCCPVSSFEACAYAWWSTHAHAKRQQFLISFDARLGERFVAILEFAEIQGRIAISWVVAPAVVAESAIGEFGRGQRDDTVMIALHDPDPRAMGSESLPMAAWIVRYAQDPALMRPHDWVAASALQPLYVREKVAQTIAERAEFPDLIWAEMTPADIASVMVIEHQAYPFPWSSGNFLDSIAAGYQLRILKEHGVMVGYTAWMPVLQEAHLLNITLSTARQGHGLGAWMLRQVLDQMRLAGMESVLLEVRPSNVRAIGLYRKQGFVQIGLRKGYYPNSAVEGETREDALVMRLGLKHD